MREGKIIALADYRKRRGGALPDGSAPHWFTHWRHWQQSLDRLEDYIANLMEDDMAIDNLTIETPANEPIIIATRTFAAPRALVFKVMTEREHVVRWWGTDGQNNRITEFDVRPGGKWRIESHEPDGQVFIFVGEYREVDAPKKFVWTFGMENMFFGKVLVETHTFEEIDGVTHYKSVSVFDNIEDRDGMVASGMEVGMRHGMLVMDQILAELVKG
ncbi:MAG: SRPBCC domain-containing protein [Devosia sp.]